MMKSYKKFRFLMLAILATITASSHAERIAEGYRHSIMACADGTVWTCGLNGNGQLGNNTTTNSNNLVQVLGPGGVGTLSNIVSVAAGSFYSMALKDDGTVWSWGQNTTGYLGDGTAIQRLTPVQVVGPGGVGFLQNITAIACTWSFALALRNDGTVWAWGYNFSGMLGDNTTVTSTTPVQVVGVGGVGTLSNIVDIATGADHSMALDNAGTVYTWGKGANGQLGTGGTANRSFPLAVTLASPAIDINGGWAHSNVVLNDNSVWSWGWNSNGQLGDNTTTQRLSPVQVVGVGGTGFLANVVEIEAGTTHSLARLNNGTLFSWGQNNGGQLGDNTTTQRTAPVQVLGSGGVGFLTNVTQIDAGSSQNYSMALLGDGTAWDWGINTWGQLGDGTTTQRNTPVQIPLTCSTLPIELTSFTAEWTDENLESVDLNWVTEGEINNEFFVVERSIDARDFKEVLKRDGAGNSTSTINYSDIDHEPISDQTTYYRLKQIDFNGEFSYSRVVPLYPFLDLEILVVYPNPADLFFNYQVYSPSTISLLIHVHNSIGQLILSEQKEVNKGLTEFTMDTGRLSEGEYTLTVSLPDQKKVVSKRFILSR